MRLLRLSSPALVLTLALAAPAARAQDGTADLVPLAPDQRALLDAVANEETPETERFYFRSNEWRQDLLAPQLVGLRGAYVGVGSDQNYTMAAMARSEVLYLVDFDRRIRTVHAIYGVLVSASPTPEALLDRFEVGQARQTLALLDERLAGTGEHDAALRTYRRYRQDWLVYLQRVRGTEWQGERFTWLGDPAKYAYMRALFRAGRVVARTGDVTSTDTLRDVARSAKALGVPVRVVYFSNAEQFFPYTDGFIANMKALPTDQRSVVVRTIRHRRIANAPDGRWHYLVHHFPDFLERLDTGAYRRSFAFVADLLAAGRPFLGTDGLSTMTLDTPRHRLETN